MNPKTITETTAMNTNHLGIWNLDQMSSILNNIENKKLEWEDLARKWNWNFYVAKDLTVIYCQTY